MFTAKGPMVLWNMSDRNLPQGIYIGHAGKSNVISIPADFSTLKHYGVDCELHRIEVSCFLANLFVFFKIIVIPIANKIFWSDHFCCCSAVKKLVTL